MSEHIMHVNVVVKAIVLSQLDFWKSVEKMSGVLKVLLKRQGQHACRRLESKFISLPQPIFTTTARYVGGAVLHVLVVHNAGEVRGVEVRGGLGATGSSQSPSPNSHVCTGTGDRCRLRSPLLLPALL